jgi:hypothetical protein
MNRDDSYLLGNKFAVGNAANRTSFQKGIVPWNKGRRGVRVSPQTEFKKGEKSINWVSIGTITVRADKNSHTPRRWIKFKDDFKAGSQNWMEYAKWLWIKENGAIPAGMCIHHINNDSMDDTIVNLIPVTRQEHPRLHNKFNTKNVPIANARIARERAQMKMAI